MHIAIADQGAEHEAANELGGAGIASLGADDAGNVSVARALVLVVRKDSEHLREILDVDGAVAGSVEAADGKRLSL